MRKETVSFSENPDDNFENGLLEALAQERSAILEIEQEKEENSFATETVTAPASKKKLWRDTQKEALARLEDSARTENDFRNVQSWWDRLEANADRRYRYHVIGRSDIPLEWGASPEEIILPEPIQHMFWKQITKGEFLDTIFDCPFPFDELDFVKRGMESSWSVSEPAMAALVMTMNDRPQAVTMSFQREYAEPYEWLVRNFTDWAFTFISSFLYYQDMDTLDDMQKDLYRQGMAAFGGIAPTYHIELLEKPTIVWDFHSLLLAIQMMFSFMLTDEKSSLKVCKHCGKVFLASRPNTVFCGGQCKNQYNVYKSRGKNQKENNNNE